MEQEQLANTPEELGIFTAYHTGDKVIPKDSPVVFKRTMYNSGQYNTTAGVFIAQVSGIYVFSLNLVSCSGSTKAKAVFKLKVESRTLGFVGTGTDSGGSYLSQVGFLHMPTRSVVRNFAGGELEQMD